MSAVLLATLVWQVIDFLRELTNLKTQKSAVVTQATAWAGGIALAFAASGASVTNHLAVPGMTMTFGQLDFWSIVLVGLVLSSLASSLVDVKQAIDSSDAAAKPPLLPITTSVATLTVSPGTSAGGGGMLPPQGGGVQQAS